MPKIDLTTASGVITRCKELRAKWNTRNKKMGDWYRILELEDELAQPGMESVVSNDPRTGYNLGRHLLATMIIAHKIETEELTNEQIPGASVLEGYVTKRWMEHESRYRGIAKQGWLWNLISWLMASGWYSIFSMVEPNGIWSEVWSPAETFPDYDETELIEVAHIYPITQSAANRKLRKKGWHVNQPIQGNTWMYDYWGFDSDGDVVNGVVLGSEFVKSTSKEPELSKVGRIPVFTGPVGGLPDMGSIKRGASWQNHFGEGVMATNEDLTKNYNKMLSFIQQTARNAAQPRYLELSNGDTPIATEASMNKYGVVLHGAIGESVDPIIPPTIPIELRQGLFDYQNMLQRGLFPNAVFGNIQQTMSYLAMANVASAALQVLTPYQEALRGLLTDMDNFWLDMINKNGLRPYKLVKPSNLPDDAKFNVQADIEIPGYLIQRATVARMLNPDFRLPITTVMDRLFPEVRDPLRAQAGVRRDMAMMNPKAIAVDSILAYREQARILRDQNNIPAAELYEKLADSLEAELSPQAQMQQAQQTTAQQQALQEVMPKELTEPQEGLGRIA